jgi:tRNA A37 threonylcarbamoyladenosine dehydratase
MNTHPPSTFIPSPFIIMIMGGVGDMAVEAVAEVEVVAAAVMDMDTVGDIKSIITGDG